MRVTMALFCTALIAAAVSAQTVPVADIPVTVDNIPYAPPETVQRVATPLNPKDARLKVLIISGQNSYEHDWTGVNNRLRTQLKDTGRFDVRVTEDFDDGTLAMLKKYDVVILNYSSRWNYGDKDQHIWSDGAFNALYTYVAEGGGLVAYHSSLTWGRDIPEYRRLVGAVMVPGVSRRSPPDAFSIELVDREHPITKGLRRYHWNFMEDKYTNMVFDPAAKVRVPGRNTTRRPTLPKTSPRCRIWAGRTRKSGCRTMARVASSRSRWAMGRTRSSMTASGRSSRAAPNGRRRGR
jgi:hypothetical protein